MEDPKRQDDHWRELAELLGLPTEPAAAPRSEPAPAPPVKQEPVIQPVAPAPEPVAVELPRAPDPAPRVIEPPHVETEMVVEVIDEGVEEEDVRPFQPPFRSDMVEVFEPDADEDYGADAEEPGEDVEGMSENPVAEGAVAESAEGAAPEGDGEKPRRGRRRRRRGRRRGGDRPEGAEPAPGAAPSREDKPAQEKGPEKVAAGAARPRDPRDNTPEPRDNRRDPRDRRPPRERGGGERGERGDRGAGDRGGADRGGRGRRDETPVVARTPEAAHIREEEQPNEVVIEAASPRYPQDADEDPLADWDVPSWQDLISSLYRPDR